MIDRRSKQRHEFHKVPTEWRCGELHSIKVVLLEALAKHSRLFCRAETPSMLRWAGSALNAALQARSPENASPCVPTAHIPDLTLLRERLGRPVGREGRPPAPARPRSAHPRHRAVRRSGAGGAAPQPQSKKRAAPDEVGPAYLLGAGCHAHIAWADPLARRRRARSGSARPAAPPASSVATARPPARPSPRAGPWRCADRLSCVAKTAGRRI